jgi:hypothetical protein
MTLDDNFQSDPQPPTPNPSLAFMIAQRLLGFISRFTKTVGQLWLFASAMLGMFFPGLSRKRKLKPWMKVRRGKGREGDKELVASEADVRRLLERMRELDDSRMLSEKAADFAGEGADFFAEPRQVEAVVKALVVSNPPFLHIARERPAEDEGKSQEYRTEYLDREADIVLIEPQTLFIPKVGVEYLESRRPPGYPILRTAKSLSDLMHAPLLYQALPDDTLFARYVEGSIPVLAYREERKYLLFEAQERMIKHVVHRKSRVPVEIESGGEGTGTRLMYMLFDRSTSLVRNCQPRGMNAIMELAIAIAMVRADLGKENARYYFRTFAERLFPLAKDPPIMASNVREKDELVQRLFKVNFSGEATNVVEALEAATNDIEHITETGELGPGIKPRIVLMTDGRATIYLNVGARLKRLGIELDTVLLGKEAARNSELVRISSTVSIVDLDLYRQAMAA